MKKYLKYIKYVALGFFFVAINSTKAQSVEDSLYNSAVIYVYDDPLKAIEISEELMKMNENQPEKQIRVLLLITNSYASMRNYEKSLETALKAKEIVKKIKDPVQEFKILIKIAAQYHSLGVSDKALQILEESDKIFEKATDKSEMMFDMGSNYAIKGFIYSDQLSCDIAIEYFNKAIETYAQSGSEEERVKLNQSVVAYNKGNCYIALNDLHAAKMSYLESRELVKGTEANSLEAFSMKGLAEVLTLEGKYNEAITKLIDAEKIAGNVGDLELNSGIYRGLADNFLALKDWDNFQKFDKKYNESIQKIKISERNTINNILNSYNQEINQKEKSWKLKYLFLISVFGIVLLLGLYSIIKSEIIFRKKLRKLKSQIKF
jgi:tetratricopeptide (TPR) repeat protein